MLAVSRAKNYVHYTKLYVFKGGIYEKFQKTITSIEKNFCFKIFHVYMYYVSDRRFEKAGTRDSGLTL
jgi:hypothetical protein